MKRDAPMSIFLIRHGETIWNAARIMQLPETPLSRRGMDQARRVANRLAELSVGAIVCSDYSRARMTAEALEAATGIDMEVLRSLRERHFGAHRATAFDDLTVDVFAPDYHPPGGESWAVFHARVERAWDEVTTIAAGVAGNTAVVTHGLVCRALVERHLEVPATLATAPVQWRNTSLTIVENAAPWRVTRLACADHLTRGP